MSDNTTLNIGIGGDVIATEDPGLGYKIPVSKIRLGAIDIDGGDVTINNPFPTGSFNSSPKAMAAGVYSYVTGYNRLFVSNEPVGSFVDSFDGNVLDTTNKWTSLLQGSGNLSFSNGQILFNVSNSAGAGASITSIPTFPPSGTGFHVMGVPVQLEAVAVAGTHRFWGWGTLPNSWAATTPMYDGVGFEQDVGGNLNACVWQAGTKTFSQTLTRPSDGYVHRYAIWWRTDLAFFYVDSLEVPVATASYPQPSTFILPIHLHLINPSTTPAATPTFNSLAVGVSESSASGNQNIADGTYNWRKAVVKSASTAAAAADNSLVVGLSPNSPLPKGNNLIGSILSTNDEFGNFQNPTVRLINGVWTLTVKDDLNREFHERNTIALEALVDIENNRLNPAVLSSVPATSDLGYVVRHAGPIPMFQDYTGTGSISALNQFTLLQVNGISSIIINIIGTWVGTLTFQYTVDGITWLSATGQITTGTFVSTTAANGTFRFSAGSYRQFRVVATAWTSGQATIYYNASAGINLITSQSIITDGSNNGPAAVKAASTAAAAADPSLVVALSPNSMKAASTAPVAADTALVVALSPNTFPIVGAAPKTNVIPIAGTDINNTISAISTLTSNGAVKLQVNEDNLRILLEQMLLVLIDIRSSLVASDLKGEAVSMSNIDTNNGN